VRRRPGADGGGVEYLGRRDAQLKVHGVRLEATEVEGALEALPHARAPAAPTIS